MREKILTNNIYHTLNRGVDKRQIFLDDEDRFRFIHDLFEFNDSQPLNNGTYRFHQYKVIARPYIAHERRSRQFLVEILAFVLMPNHYHLLLKPKIDGGTERFMKRLNMGYARYFNEKYDRSGALFEGRYKLVPVNNESHFLHLPYYIHLNPLDLFDGGWRQRELKDHNKALAFLENYRWSSFQDYIGKKNFPSVTQREFLRSFWGKLDHRLEVLQWLKNINLNNLEDVTLD